MPTQQWLKPTEPRLRSPRIRTQAAKPPTKADDGGTPASAVEIRRSPQPTTQPLADPPRPVSQPAPRATPASGQKPEPCSRGISRLTQALGKGASPAGKPGTHVRGRGGAGRGETRRRARRKGAGRPDAGEGGVQRPVDRRCHCPDRPLGLGRARMLCAGLAAESGGVAVCPCACRFGCHDVVGVGARRSRASGTGRATAPGGRAWGESREPPLGRGRRTLGPHGLAPLGRANPGGRRLRAGLGRVGMRWPGSCGSRCSPTAAGALSLHQGSSVIGVPWRSRLDWM